MADHAVRLEPTGTKRREHSEAGGHESGLLHLRRLGHGLGDLAPHALLQRALAREAECDLHAASSVHSSNAEPHVRPAPIPVISTRSPFLKRPSPAASASASGMEPAEVLPYRSTLITTRSGRMPSFSAACRMIRTFAWCGTYTSTSSTATPHSSSRFSADETSTRVANLKTSRPFMRTKCSPCAIVASLAGTREPPAGT